MKLTNPQIENLYKFTRQHYVYHYDVQSELVDHLANDIEEIWQAQPDLSFISARDKSFKKFGIFGFMEPIEQKQKAMSKRYRRYLLVELKKWFAVPQIVITLALFLFFYYTFSTVYVEYLSVIFYIIIAIWCGYKSWQLNRIFKRRKEKSNKKWMLEDLIFKQAGGITGLFLSQLFNVISISDTSLNNKYAILAFALLFTFLVLINYISLELLPNKAEKLINETYPEFSL